MIDPTSEAVFPNNVVRCLEIVLPGIDPDVAVFPRPLRPSDPDHSIGVYAALWQPDEDSYEMKGIGSPHASEPTLQTYQIGIQSLVKHGDSTVALAISSILNNRIRSVLYRNAPLAVALGSLYTDDGTVRESMRRWGVRSQRYMSNDIEGKFVFISVLDFWIETETKESL